jgi:VWFA-related protein
MKRFVFFALVAATVTSGSAQQQPTPRFRSGVDVIPVDVMVIDRATGLPVLDLKPEDFTVRIDGRERRILSVAAPASRPAGPTGPTSGSTGPTSGSPGPTSDSSGPTRVSPGPILVPAAPLAPRPVILILDQPNTRFGAIREHRDALNRFIDGLAATDPISVVSLGAGGRSVGFTTDRNEIRRVISNTVGGQPYPPLGSTRTPGEQTVDVLQRLIVELQGISGPKTIVLVTENPTFDQRRPRFEQLRREAALARATVHVLRLAPPRINASRADVRPETAIEPSTTDILARPVETETVGGVTIERFQRDGPNIDPLDGLEGISGIALATGGSVFNVVNIADAAFDRITATLAGYYLLGVESQQIDSDGLARRIEVTINRPGLIVTHRTQFQAR